MKERIAEIICVGTELLMGETVNTNATEIARELSRLGIPLYHSVVVGDNPARLKAALKSAYERAEIVLLTGGLGPTYDDLTMETVADFFGRKLVLHEESLAAIRQYFEKAGRMMAPSNEKQALLPEGGIVLPNPNGTAPGCILEDGERVAVVLPGPPREMRPMLRDQVAPYLGRGNGVIRSHELHFYGIGESELEYKLGDLMKNALNPTVAPYAKPGDVMLRVTASAGTAEEAERQMAPVMDKLRDKLKDYYYATDLPDLQTAVVRALHEKGLTAATAESCTGGLVAELLTEVPGASGVFGCGMVAYQNEIKEQLLGVPGELLKAYGAVSEETAVRMAEAIREKSGADIGVGVTGNAGPAASEGKPVGLVYVAVSSSAYTHVSRLNIRRQDEDSRALIRRLAALKALNLILRAAQAAPPTEH